MKRTEGVKRLDTAIAERNLPKHPFYQDWQAGKLSRPKLQLYAAQYYLHVEAFPVYLAELAVRSKGSWRALILENLMVEEDPHSCGNRIAWILWDSRGKKRCGRALHFPALGG